MSYVGRFILDVYFIVTIMSWNISLIIFYRHHTYENVAGVLCTEFSFTMWVKSNTDGHILIGLPRRSSLIMTTTTPEGPIFFCAPANMTPNWKYFNHLENFLFVYIVKWIILPSKRLVL